MKILVGSEQLDSPARGVLRFHVYQELRLFFAGDAVAAAFKRPFNAHIGHQNAPSLDEY